MALEYLLDYKDADYPIELKLRYSEKTYQEGKQQLAGYMEKLGCPEGWLIVFDRRATIEWSDKIFWKTHKMVGKTIHIVGC